MRLSVVLVAVTCLGGALGVFNLYDHGNGHGDDKGPKLDDDFVEKTMTVPFMFYGMPHLKSFVNENGAISFLANFWEFIPEPLPGDNDFPLVLPFWGDVIIEEGGNIFSRVGSDNPMRKQIKDDIKASFADCHNNFKPTEYVLATYKKVLAYCNDEGGTSEGVNIYQVALATDGVESYVIFNYKKLEWVEGCPDELSVAGFNAGDGQRYFELPDSSSLDIANLASDTNDNKGGRWIYKVSGAGIMDSDCDPVDNYECECHATDTVVTKYDDSETTITGVEKVPVSTWNFDDNDACKFSVVAKPWDTLNGEPHDPYFGWVAIYVGIHSSNSEKFHANWRIENGQVIRRGQGFPPPAPAITLPTTYESPDGLTNLYIVQEGNTYQFHSTLCPFTFHVTQDATDPAIITNIDVWVGDKYQDGNLEGTCGQC